jgi:DivIVA domain-containing protein
MSLSSEDISNRQFSLTRGRGYDKGEVDNFLRQVAEEFEAMAKKASGVEARRDGYEELGQEVSTVLRATRISADEIRREAEDRARAIEQAAEQNAIEREREATRTAKAVVDAGHAEAEKTRAEAQRFADEERAQAEREHAEFVKEAESILVHAREQAEHLIQQSQRFADEQLESAKRDRAELAARAKERLHAYDLKLRERVNELSKAVSTFEAILDEEANLENPRQGLDLAPGDQRVESLNEAQALAEPRP